MLHGTRCPQSVNSVLKTFHTLTKPNSVLLQKKNENIHPFEDAASLEFLALKNECGVVVFGTHSKKRPNNITVLRIYDGKVLDMVELLLIASPDQPPDLKLQIGVGMKPMILFAGSQWDDTSASAQAAIYQALKSLLLDLFQGEEISSIDVAGLQHLLMIGAGEPANSSSNSDDPANKPVLHLRWYQVRTTRSDTPKIPRVELDQIGPSFDFRVGRFREADALVMKEAMKHGSRPNEPRMKKNIETDIIGDKMGRVHLGKQDLSTLQSRKMKGLKRAREDAEEEMNESDPDGREGDMVSQDEDTDAGGMDVDDMSEGRSSGGGTGDEISIGEDDDDMNGEDDQDEQNKMPKRQRLA